MPSRVKVASGIFQRFIGNFLACIQNLTVKIDNILVSGKSDREHLENVESVKRYSIGATVN